MDVKSIRESLGMSQREFAERFEVSQSMVNRWESGDALPGSTHELGLAALEQSGRRQSRLDPYPSAPVGGRPGTREAEERLAWVRARNRAIQAGVVPSESLA